MLPPLAQVSGRREEIEQDCRDDDDDMERLSDAEGSLCGEYDSAVDEIYDNISEDGTWPLLLFHFLLFLKSIQRNTDPGM